VQAPTDIPGNFQAYFHARWNHLNDPDVRTLAWLLDAPDLLDPEAPQWQGRVATLGPVDQATTDWLHALDQAPGELRRFLGAQPFTRLGRHAEKLMAFYLEWCGRLVAHGVQVCAGKGGTIGEFDFLLRDDTPGASLLHWEFATKLYLLEASGDGHQADYFVGPNLADTLGAKIRKIMDRQLLLSQHPAAQHVLPAPVSAAQALVKGWLFYHGQTPLQPPGIARAHCRGFWCSLEEFDALATERVILLPRLGWLAPAKASEAGTQNRNDLRDLLHTHFNGNGMPVLVALLDACDDHLLEVDRGFVVPNDWRCRAAAHAIYQASDLPVSAS
jgi:uncharacterized protein